MILSDSFTETSSTVFYLNGHESQAAFHDLISDRQMIALAIRNGQGVPLKMRTLPVD